MKRDRWTSEEQKKQIGVAMAIATTANLLLGLRCTEKGKEFIGSILTHGGMDSELCDAGAQYILIPMLPFAVESCLKCVKSQGGGEFRRTHNLDLLWKDLDEVERTEIQKLVDCPVWRDGERTLREALGITCEMRTVDQVLETHKNDFVHWRYVVDGEKNLTEELKHLRTDEAIMDLFGIVYACVEYHKSRGSQQ